jgi:hypothetical protein
VPAGSDAPTPVLVFLASPWMRSLADMHVSIAFVVACLATMPASCHYVVYLVIPAQSSTVVHLVEEIRLLTNPTTLHPHA